MTVRNLLLAVALSGVTIAVAQDTTRVQTQTVQTQTVQTQTIQPKPEAKDEKLIHQEIGFNLSSILMQVDMLEIPSSQLPYLLFYNILYKDMVGLRFGAGIYSSSDQAETDGRLSPVIENRDEMNFRAGATYNFARHKAVTFNVFGDFLLGRSKTESISTSTSQAMFEPILVTTTKNTDTDLGYGVQAGFGVKVDIYKNLSLYTELPIGWYLNRQDTEDLITDDGGRYSSNITRRFISTYYMTPPISIYLVLRF